MKIEISLTITASPEIVELLQRLLREKTAAGPAAVDSGGDYYVADWALENLQMKKGEETPARCAYEHYQVWCDVKGVALPASQKKFGDEMTKLGYSRKKIGGTYRYLNFTLKPENW